MPAFVSSFSTSRIARKELVSLRSGERVKHFAIGDNVVSEFHTAPLHFKRDGSWLDIDTTLQTEADKYITYDNKVSVGFRNDGSLSKYLGIRHDESHQFEVTLKKLRLNNIVILLPANFSNVEVKETHSAFWFCLYNHQLNIPICKRIHKCRSLLRYLINFFALYLNKNPFLKDSNTRKKREFYTQIFVKAKK